MTRRYRSGVVVVVVSFFGLISQLSTEDTVMADQVDDGRTRHILCVCVCVCVCVFEGRWRQKKKKRHTPVLSDGQITVAVKRAVMHRLLSSATARRTSPRVAGSIRLVCSCFAVSLSLSLSVSALDR